MLSESLQCMLRETSNESLEVLDRFVVLMYARTSEAMEVNFARRQLFTHKSQTLESIPPTQASHQTHLLPGQLLEAGIDLGSRSRYTTAI